ncbi:MAG: transglycosylase domain-containing protein [Budvicia sp.]|nr:transglycosylase domain-containing protein [Budvicia sp.]
MSLIKRLLIWLVKLTIGFCLIVLIGFVSYYFVEISPHRDGINASGQKYAGSDAHQRLMRDVVRQDSAESSGRTYYAVRTLSFKYLDGQRLANLRRHAREILWFWWLNILYTDDEIVSIWLNEVYFGSTEAQQPIYGIEHAGLAYFGVPSSALNCEQLVKLVVITRSPSMYKVSPERFNTRIEKILPICNGQ